MRLVHRPDQTPHTRIRIQGPICPWCRDQAQGILCCLVPCVRIRLQGSHTMFTQFCMPGFDSHGFTAVFAQFYMPRSGFRVPVLSQVPGKSPMPFYVLDLTHRATGHRAPCGESCGPNDTAGGCIWPAGVEYSWFNREMSLDLHLLINLVRVLCFLK